MKTAIRKAQKTLSPKLGNKGKRGKRGRIIRKKNGKRRVRKLSAYNRGFNAGYSAGFQQGVPRGFQAGMQ